MKSVSTALGYDVFIAEPIPQNVTELVPNGERRMFCRCRSRSSAVRRMPCSSIRR